MGYSVVFLSDSNEIAPELPSSLFLKSYINNTKNSEEGTPIPLAKTTRQARKRRVYVFHAVPDTLS